MKRKRTLSNDFEQNVETLSKELRVDKNFDLVQHNFQIGDIKLCMFLVDGFGNDLAIIHTLENLSRLDGIKDNVMAHLEHRFIPQSEIERSNDLDEILTNVLAGQSALLVEGYDEALMIDAREYPVRSPEEPDLERVVRGPRDGFVETLVFNSALIRRRLRDPSLIMEHVQVGTRSKTDIVIGYISSVADPEIAKRLKKETKIRQY